MDYKKTLEITSGKVADASNKIYASFRALKLMAQAVEDPGARKILEHIYTDIFMAQDDLKEIGETIALVLSLSEKETTIDQDPEVTEDDLPFGGKEAE